MRVTSKGQVTIPRDLRDIAGIQPNSEVVFTVENGKVAIAPKDADPEAAENERMRQFLDVLERLKGTGDQFMSADDVMRITRGH